MKVCNKGIQLILAAVQSLDKHSAVSIQDIMEEKRSNHRLKGKGCKKVA